MTKIMPNTNDAEMRSNSKRRITDRADPMLGAATKPPLPDEKLAISTTIKQGQSEVKRRATDFPSCSGKNAASVAATTPAATLGTSAPSAAYTLAL